jgi:hypothetical protein
MEKEGLVVMERVSFIPIDIFAFLSRVSIEEFQLFILVSMTSHHIHDFLPNITLFYTCELSIIRWHRLHFT